MGHYTPAIGLNGLCYTEAMGSVGHVSEAPRLKIFKYEMCHSRFICMLKWDETIHNENILFQKNDP